MATTPTATPPPAAGSLDWRGIGWFLLLAFGLTWTFEVAVFIVPGVRLEEPPMWANLVLPISMVFPAVAAYVTRRWITREGFASAGLRLGPLSPYVAVWLLMPVGFAVVYLIPCLFGLGRLDPELTKFTVEIKKLADATGSKDELPAPYVIWLGIIAGSMTSGPLLTSLFTFGEEFGWTGYLTVKLAPLGKWPTALIYGILWGLWHAPLIWMGLNYPGHPVSGIVLMCVFTTVLGFSQLALRLRYGSVLLTSFFHACINTQALGVFHHLVVDVDPMLGEIQGVAGIVLLTPLGVWLLATSPDGQDALTPAHVT